MKVYIASDHGGFYLKEELKKHLADKGYQVKDFGAYTFDSKDDYPDFVLPLAEEVAQKGKALGVILGRSGSGEAIAANKVKGIRAVLCINPRHAQKAREHNHANVISLGADFINPTTAKKIVETFLNSQPSTATRHTRRLGKIKKYESSHLK